MKNSTQASVHVVLQGKGGVGKSFISAILAQYFRTKSAPVHCLDTDPVNATFAQYRLLEAEHLKVVGAVVIRERNPHTYGDDVRQMLERRLTFDEAIQNASFSLVSKQRLEIVRREIFEQLDKLAIA